MRYPTVFGPLIVALIFTICIMPAPLRCEEKIPASGQEQPQELMKRIDFRTTRITGQTIKSGAVYLMHRKQSDIDSMLKVRQDYRKEIRREYGLENTAAADESRNGGKGEKQ